MKAVAATQPHDPQAGMFGVDESALRRSYAAKKLATAVDVLPIQYGKANALLPAVHGFNGRVLDGEPQLLQQSFELRYQVYCLERGFLPAERYPTAIETDAFDAHSLHIGTLDPLGALVGTARLVRPSAEGLPIFEHCQLSGGVELQRARVTGVEVSRLAVSRQYRRSRDGGGALVVALYRSLYEVSKTFGYTHWLVATEPSLQRLVAKFGFPFRQIGPEVDYLGPVAPYLMDLSEFDRVVMSGKHSALETFHDVLKRDLASSPQLATA